MSFFKIPVYFLISVFFLTGCNNLKTNNNVFNQNKTHKASDIYTDLGFAYLTRQIFDKALLNFKKALDYNAKNSATWHGLALVMQEQNNTKLADEYFHKALDLNSTSSEILNNYGLFLYEQADYKTAIEYLEKAAKNIFLSNRADIFLNIGYCFAKLGKHEEADKNFNEAINTATNKNPYYRILLKYYGDTKNIKKLQTLVKKLDNNMQLYQDVQEAKKLIRDNKT